MGGAVHAEPPISAKATTSQYQTSPIWRCALRRDL